MRHERFEWDEQKAQANVRKHGVSFLDAMRMLQDPYAEWFHLEVPQPETQDTAEERWMTICSDPFGRHRILSIVWTPRITRDGEVTRLISARPASRYERKRYEEEIF